MTTTYMVEPTGERFLPWLLEWDYLTAYEHIHRYLFAAQFTENKRVLDVACGEGFGTEMLAERAQHVLGIDIDSTTIAHARQHHARDNVEYIEADAQYFDVERESCDTAVSFETIEHLGSQASFLAAIKSALTPDGLLIISTPNPEVYAHAGGAPNPFHVRELSCRDFVGLLKRNFRNVQLYGQSTLAGSVIANAGGGRLLPDGQPCQFSATEITASQLDYPVAVDPMVRPRYYLALCSDAPLPTVSNDFMVDNNEALMKSFMETLARLTERTHENARLEQQIAERGDENARLAQQVAMQVEEHARLQQAIAAHAAENARLEGQAAAQAEENARLEQQAETLTGQVETLAEQIGAHQQAIADQAEQLQFAAERAEFLIARERDLRDVFMSTHVQLIQRDDEILRLRADQDWHKGLFIEKERYIAQLEWERTEQKGYIDHLEATIPPKEAYIAQLERERVEQKRYIDQLEAGIPVKEGYIAQLEIERLAQKQYIDLLEASIPAREGHIAQLEAERLRQRGHADRLEAQLAAHRDRAAGIEADWNEKNGYISRLEAQLSIKNERMNELEARVARLSEHPGIRLARRARRMTRFARAAARAAHGG